jgi:hypothetical protein
MEHSSKLSVPVTNSLEKKPQMDEADFSASLDQVHKRKKFLAAARNSILSLLPTVASLTELLHRRQE